MFRELRFRPRFKQYLHNTGWLLFEKVFRLVINLLIVIWLARYLGPEAFGIFNYAQSFAWLFAVFSVLGLSEISTRELTKNEAQRDTLLGTAFWLRTAASVLTMLAIAATVPFTDNDRLTNLLIFIIAFSMFFQNFNVIYHYFASKVLSQYSVYARTIAFVLASAYKVYLLGHGGSLAEFGFAVLLEHIFAMLFGIFFYLRRGLKITAWKFDPKTAKTLLGSSWPLILTAVGVSISLKIDQIMLKAMLDSSAVGLYAAAVKLSEVWYFIPTVISLSLFPAIVNAKKADEAEYMRRLRYLYTLMVWMAVSVALVMSLFGSEVVRRLYGEAYHAAAGILVIHVWAGIFIFTGTVWSKWMLAENRSKIIALYQAVTTVSNILLNVMLIPVYGAQGAAFALLVSTALAPLLLPLFLPSQRAALMMLLHAFFFFAFSKKAPGS